MKSETPTEKRQCWSRKGWRRRSIWMYIEELRQQTGLTVFLTTHYLEEAEVCDRIAIIDRGHIVV